MRCSPTIVLCILLTGSAVAADKAEDMGQTLSDRINNPDRNKQYQFGGASTSAREGKSKKKVGKEFYYLNKVQEKKARTKTFNTSSYYSGKSKRVTGGKKKFATSSANVKIDHSVPNVGKKVSTDTYTTEASRDAIRAYGTSQYTNTYETQVRGTAQGSIDAQYGQNNAEDRGMSLNDVKDLLNRHR